MTNNKGKQPVKTIEIKIGRDVFEVKTKWLIKQVLPELRRFGDSWAYDIVNDFLDYLEKECK